MGIGNELTIDIARNEHNVSSDLAAMNYLDATNTGDVTVYIG